MKLTVFKGIMHDLINHLDLHIWFGKWKDLPAKVDTNVLEGKDRLSKMCVRFFKERLPKSFDFNRIEEIRLRISRSMTSLKIKIDVKIDGKELSHTGVSLI